MCGIIDTTEYNLLIEGCSTLDELKELQERAIEEGDDYFVALIEEAIDDF